MSLKNWCNVCGTIQHSKPCNGGLCNECGCLRVKAWNKGGRDAVRALFAQRRAEFAARLAIREAAKLAAREAAKQLLQERAEVFRRVCAA